MRLIAALALLLTGCAAGSAQTPLFQGKAITMLIGAGAGGGTDSSGRLIGAFLADHLPGKPSLVVRNMPGANGMTGMNYFTQQIAPDGLTITMGSSTQADPLHYRRAQSHYDPATFEMVGGAGRGGTVLIVNKAAESRLYDKSQRPVVMGSLIGVPRSGMQMTAWGVQLLGWNAKWVVGYPDTNELLLALERGEIDMTSTANLGQFQKLMKTGQFKPLMQSSAGRGDFGGAPAFPDAVRSRIDTPVVASAFAFWSAMSTIDKWVALPPRTPALYVEAYRKTYEQALHNSEFIEMGQSISEDFTPMPHGEVEALVKTIAGTPPEAVDYITHMLHAQGLETE